MWLKYRKKPVVIEAVPSPGRMLPSRMLNFFMVFYSMPVVISSGKTPVGFPGWHFEDESFGLVIRTLEGDHYITPGDMIIRVFWGSFIRVRQTFLKRLMRMRDGGVFVGPRFVFSAKGS